MKDLVEQLEAAAEGVAGMTARELAQLLWWLRDVKAAAQHAYKAAEAEFCALGENVDVPGYGEFVVRRSRPRKNWDHPMLAQRVVRAALERKEPDPETGEIPPEHVVATAALLSCARMEWRVTAVRDLDIDPDRYCDHDDEWTTSVQLPARGVEG